MRLFFSTQPALPGSNQTDFWTNGLDKFSAENLSSVTSRLWQSTGLSFTTEPPVQALNTNKKYTNHKSGLCIFGRGRRTRTLTNGFGDRCATIDTIHLFKMVDQQGLEPRTNRLWAGCSNQLSYWSTYHCTLTAKVIIHLFFLFVNINLKYFSLKNIKKSVIFLMWRA